MLEVELRLPCSDMGTSETGAQLLIHGIGGKRHILKLFLNYRARQRSHETVLVK